jgi:hypothetical protein
MSLTKRKPKKKKSTKSSSKLKRNKSYNIDPKSVEWEKFSGSSDTPLKEGELIRRVAVSDYAKQYGKYEYGVADGGFGMSPDTIGGAIYVRTLTNISGILEGNVLTLSNDRRLHDDIKKAGIHRWHRDHDKVERVKDMKKYKREQAVLRTIGKDDASVKKKTKYVGRDKKMYEATIKKLKAKPSVHNFQTYLTIVTNARIRNIKVGKKRKDGTRFARWEQQKSDGTWFNASTSYLTDEGYVDGW